MTSSNYKLKNDSTEALLPSADMVTRFVAFLQSLPQLIADERDMCGYTGQDPAVDRWFRAAEASRQRTLSACQAVLDATAPHAFDVALQKAAEIFKTIEESRDPAEVHRNRENANLRRWAWLVPADTRWSNEYNQLIHCALDAIEIRLKLEDLFDKRAQAWADEGSDLSHPSSGLDARHHRACKRHLPWEHHMHTQPKQAKAHRAVPFNLINGRSRPLYVPHRSRHVLSSEWRQFEGPILPEWQQFAEQKGFRVHARVRDSRHLELECHRCGSLTAHKLYTLRTARPRCGGCTGGSHQSLVEQAQLVFLYRDARAHRYAYYRAKCGHRVRRQFEFVHRVALALTDVRCEMCLQGREEAEALKQGWTRLGRDVKGNPNYRLYQHSCGREQRAARANMQWGQVSCRGCGKTWSSKPSYLYLVSIEVGGETPRLLKLGYSKNPEKRMRHQLGLPRSAKAEILRVVAMPTGHDACEAEQAAHATLLRQMPAAVPAQTVYGHVLNVTSEVYFPAAEPKIHALLDAIEADVSSTSLIT